MKQMVSLLLVLTMVLSLFAGCGSTQTEEKTEEPMVAATIQPTETASTTEPATEPTTEPTLSPEEMLYNSLPDRMKQAVDVGIVELSQLENLERECTIEEAAQMLQNAYNLRNGTESKLMADVLALDKGSRLLHRIDSLLCPGIGLLLNGPQADPAFSALTFRSCLAVAHQNGDHVIIQTQIPDKTQQNLQFFRIQRSSQQPLDFFIQALEGRIIIHHLVDIFIRIGRPLAGGNGHRPLLGQQPQLPQHRGSAV